MRENDYFKKIDTYREEMIADLQQLIRKESTPQIPEEGVLRPGGGGSLCFYDETGGEGGLFRL